MPKTKTDAAAKPARPRKTKSATADAAPAAIDISVTIDGPSAAKKGRRTKYEPSMCGTIIALGKKGKSKTQMAAHLDISRSTFDRWLEANEDFREAWELADTHAQAFWEEIGAGGVGNKFFNDRAWSLQVRNRFPRDYKESRELELSGVGGAPIQIIMTPSDANL
jgi:DNA-binding XRE family transcriptional regulator